MHVHISSEYVFVQVMKEMCIQFIENLMHYGQLLCAYIGNLVMRRCLLLQHSEWFLQMTLWALVTSENLLKLIDVVQNTAIEVEVKGKCG